MKRKTSDLKIFRENERVWSFSDKIFRENERVWNEAIKVAEFFKVIGFYMVFVFV